MTRYETISTADGEHFDAFCALPESQPAPGILLFQEIFGINDNMRATAERLAGEGYVVIVPDMFWRIERRFERKGEEGFADAFAIMLKFDLDAAVGDIEAAHAHLLAMRECNTKVGAMGFCLGGTLAFVAGTSSRPGGAGPHAVVAYYGSGINGVIRRAKDLQCPTLFHYGTRDQFISEQQIAEVEQAVGKKPDVVVHRYDAGHAFSNWDAPSMYDHAAAELAWSRTLTFLATHVGGSP